MIDGAALLNAFFFFFTMEVNSTTSGGASYVFVEEDMTDDDMVLIAGISENESDGGRMYDSPKKQPTEKVRMMMTPNQFVDDLQINNNMSSSLSSLHAFDRSRPGRNPKWLGRRKQRRFENDHLLGVHDHKTWYDPPPSPLKGNYGLPSLHPPSSPPRETIFKTFQKHHSSMVEMFIDGNESASGREKQPDAEEEREMNRHRSSRVCATKEGGALVINKRIKKLLRPSIYPIIEAVETVLHEVKASNKVEKFKSFAFLENGGIIVFQMKTSFHRFLCHIVADFYGFASSSYNKLVDGNTVRETKVFFEPRSAFPSTNLLSLLKQA